MTVGRQSHRTKEVSLPAPHFHQADYCLCKLSTFQIIQLQACLQKRPACWLDFQPLLIFFPPLLLYFLCRWPSVTVGNGGKKTQDSKDWILGPKRISNQQLKDSPFPYSDKEEQESLQMKKDAPRALCQDFNNIKTGMWEEERKRRWRARGPAVSTGCVDRRSPGAAERSRQS